MKPSLQLVNLDHAHDVIDRFQAALAASEAREAATKARLLELRELLDDCENVLQTAKTGGAVPSDAFLDRVRATLAKGESV